MFETITKSYADIKQIWSEELRHMIIINLQ